MTRARSVVEAKGLVHEERHTSSRDGIVDCRATSGRPRPLRWPTSAALQLLTLGGVQSSWRRPDRVYIKYGLDAVTWPANKIPFKRAKSAANSAKMSSTPT